MNIHKILFPRKANLIKEMDAKIWELDDQVKDLERKTFDLGILTVNSPFLPEDIGFESLEKYDDEHGFLIVYSKDGWNMWRTAEQYHKFVVIDPKKVRQEILLPNLRDAIITLKGIGLLEYNKDPLVDEFKSEEK